MKLRETALYLNFITHSKLVLIENFLGQQIAVPMVESFVKSLTWKVKNSLSHFTLDETHVISSTSSSFSSCPFTCLFILTFLHTFRLRFYDAFFKWWSHLFRDTRSENEKNRISNTEGICDEREGGGVMRGPRASVLGWCPYQRHEDPTSEMFFDDEESTDNAWGYVARHVIKDLREHLRHFLKTCLPRVVHSKMKEYQKDRENIGKKTKLSSSQAMHGGGGLPAPKVDMRLEERKEKEEGVAMGEEKKEMQKVARKIL